MTVVLYIKLEKFLSNCKVVNATVLELRKDFTIWVSSSILQPAWQAVTYLLMVMIVNYAQQR